VSSGEVASFRDEADYREFAMGDVVVLLAEGRPALSWNCWVPPSIWMPLRGAARLCGRDLRIGLAADEMFVCEQNNRLTVQAAGTDASLVGVLLPPERIRAVARRELGTTPADPLLFPGVIRSEPALGIPLLRLAHAALRGDDPDGGARAADELTVELLRRQSAVQPMVDRCPGRSPRYRRQLFLRLTRVRNHIELGGGSDSSLARLADIAKLSPTHFLRVYRDVFGQTPHRHVVATRLAAARDLLLRTQMGVTELCRTLGFENRCAFARVFKQHYGVAPTRLRALAATAQRAAAPVAVAPPAVASAA
jgi:AraC family transcriptional regulator